MLKKGNAMEPSTHELYEMHVVIKGKVQGVGFRALTHRHAMVLGIKGTVRNLEDGTVEIYAQGSKQKLEELVRILKEETAPRQIQEASIDYFPIESPQLDFRILY
jgi:acylphosphatase